MTTLAAWKEDAEKDGTLCATRTADDGGPKIVHVAMTWVVGRGVTSRLRHRPDEWFSLLLDARSAFVFASSPTIQSSKIRQASKVAWQVPPLARPESSTAKCTNFFWTTPTRRSPLTDRRIHIAVFAASYLAFRHCSRYHGENRTREWLVDAYQQFRLFHSKPFFSISQDLS
ncbi:uncharacterized protein CLUP02_11142 [Colletotrichum lupini]|uniref:Uncharacterized protein n=1 Tax=Colletotrichum lupini TaxID=145971 RepID=A0A9Q8WJ81_9PEZI|nr:uncharacterized protein CLUP02_11142 [Colletotrichum lupini]UQC85643.1 hypothetical protein CLUP02_11142 [Colletotrichum lupini]